MKLIFKKKFTIKDTKSYAKKSGDKNRIHIDIDVEKLNLGESIRLTEISLPEGSEIPGLSEENDQMIISINEPRAIEEDPIIEENLEDGEVAEGQEAASDSIEDEEASPDDTAPKEEESKEDKKEES